MIFDKYKSGNPIPAEWRVTQVYPPKITTSNIVKLTSSVFSDHVTTTYYIHVILEKEALQKVLDRTGACSSKIFPHPQLVEPPSKITRHFIVLEKNRRLFNVCNRRPIIDTP